MTAVPRFGVVTLVTFKPAPPGKALSGSVSLASTSIRTETPGDVLAVSSAAVGAASDDRRKTVTWAVLQVDSDDEPLCLLFLVHSEHTSYSNVASVADVVPCTALNVIVLSALTTAVPSAGSGGVGMETAEMLTLLPILS